MNKENQMDKKVSVMVAVYNIEKYIGKCIQSIIDQEYTNLEIILVDDCSTDLSGEICDNYAMKDDRIQVIHHENNTRLPGVRNDGLDYATGDYIVFVDGDDWLASDFVTYMLDVIIQTESDMAINLVNFTTRDKKQVAECKPQIWSAEKATAELLFPHLTVGAWNKIYNRAFIEKYHLRFKTDLYTAEGEFFINAAAQRANHVGVGYRKVYYYRLNNTESATTKYDIKQSEGAIYAMKEIEKNLIIRTPYVKRALNQHIWLNHFWNLRQILALKGKENYWEAYQESLTYTKKYAFSSAKGEPSVNKKIKYCLTGIFPVLAAKIKNALVDVKLKKDVIRHSRMDKENKSDDWVKVKG